MDNLDWKDKLASAFNVEVPETENEPIVEEVDDTLPSKQNLKILLDKRNRKGKAVTLIVDFVGSDEALKQLATQIKSQLGCGGSSRNGEILIQGDVRQKVQSILVAKGYKARII